MFTAFDKLRSTSKCQSLQTFGAENTDSALQKFINAPILSLWEPFTALIVSLIISFSFNSLTKEKRVGASDRVGFTVAVLYFGLIPWIYVVTQKVAHEKQDIRNFLRETQLSTIIFLIHKLSCDFPTIMLTATLYTVPFLLLIESNMSNTQQWLWMASLLCIIFTHLYLWRFITQAFSFLFDSATVAFVTTVLLLTISYLTSGLVSHPAFLNSMVLSISPHRWTSQAFLEADFLG
ncbi:unnamed protein product [Cylicocyclus nassatus]|uniref:ABC-2 type transporter transmembrane domain-containing protein n=1 Tax=Cylicocyclus nassatus TaxID=53992 RepID=A0AA36HB69_CYLNA|nr:unnamed protein product [Cylicocyclus nassatus]